MNATKGRVKVTLFTALAVLFVFAGGILVLTAAVFAEGDNSPHGNNSHVHTNDTGEDDVDWIVKVGKLEWNGVSTYCWHSVYAINHRGNHAAGDWEWKHHVRNKDNTWSKTDKIWTRDVTLNAGESLSSSGWTSIDLPSTPGVEYRIEAYTRISLIKNRRNITSGTGQRNIMSVWFEKI